MNNNTKQTEPNFYNLENLLCASKRAGSVLNLVIEKCQDEDIVNALYSVKNDLNEISVCATEMMSDENSQIKGLVADIIWVSRFSG